MTLHARYPSVEDLRRRARARIPKFVFEYLDSGTGTEATTARNETMLDDLRFLPSILHGPQTPDISTTLLGTTFPRPFGIAPVGMSGLVWPDAERHLAREAARAGLPYCLSTVASQTPEHVAPVIGENAWFQLYAPKDEGILKDMVARVKAAGFEAMVLTVDVPVASRRERQVRSGLTQPPRFTPRLMWQTARRPAWALGMARTGAPRMRFLESYMQDNRNLPPTEHIGYLLRTSPDLSYLRRLRDAWDGKLILKGVLDPEQILGVEAEGVDALWVSNHAGRQFDAAPSSIEMLPALRAASDLPIIFDSGVRGGLDILRALALGADFVMLGRAWHFALAALGAQGPAHLTEVLQKDMEANMGQIGAAKLDDVSARLILPEWART